MHTYRVADWMSTPPIVVAPTVTLAEAQRLMEQRRVRRLPVVESGRLLGIVTGFATIASEQRLPPTPAAASDDFSVRFCNEVSAIPNQLSIDAEYRAERPFDLLRTVVRGLQRTRRNRNQFFEPRNVTQLGETNFKR